MKTSSDFEAHCLDLFSGLHGAEARSMFGGHAFFVGRAMFAIGDADEWKVWLKVDGATRARFEEAGGEAFTYAAKGRPAITMSFVTPPDDAMEGAEAMRPWAELALAAAERAVARRKPKRGPGAGPRRTKRPAGASHARPERARAKKPMARARRK